MHFTVINVKEFLIYIGEVRVKRPPLTLNLRPNGLERTSKPPPSAGQTDRSGVIPPSSSSARRLIQLCCDTGRTLYIERFVFAVPLK
ncbi:hypothetical protein J6590_075040 [Homalodisca vitripennis]|nr:hypothetical protein J6590_075040 [Homalodisca vitripennis]